MGVDLSWAPAAQQQVENLHSWLLQVEPAILRGSPLPLRVLVLWFIATIGTGMLLALPVLLGEAAAAAAHRVARLAATNSAPHLIDLLARLTVQLERVIRRYGLELPLGEKYGYAARGDIQPFLFADLPARSPRASHLLAFFAAAVVVPILTLGTLAAALIREIVGQALRFSAINLLAWTAVMWHLDWLAPIASRAARLALPDIALTQVVALATVLVVIYAAVGSDLRGRIEINKTASVEVRKALLSAHKPLGEIADSINGSYRLLVAHAREFPRPQWLAKVTGDPSSRWRFNTIDHPDRWFRQRPLIAALAAELEAGGPHGERERDIFANALDRERTETTERLAVLIEHLGEATDQVDELARMIADAGYESKLSAVLPGSATYAWTHLTNARFALELVQSMALPGASEWDRRYCPSLSIAKEEWASADTAEERDSAAAYTAQLIRLATRSVHADLWQLAVTEHRVRMLRSAILSMLDPRPFERLRQAVHK